MQLLAIGEEADHVKLPETTFVKVMLEVVLGVVTPLNVTDQLVPEGKPLSVKVTEYVAGTKFAVIVPEAPTTAVVEEAVAEPNVIEVVDEVHDENT